MTETLPTREESISDGYTTRAETLVGVRTVIVEETEAAAAESGLESVDTELPPEAQFTGGDEEPASEEETDEKPPTPDMTWLKADIVDYINSTTGTSRDELEALTKQELLDRYVTTA